MSQVDAYLKPCNASVTEAGLLLHAALPREDRDHFPLETSLRLTCHAHAGSSVLAQMLTRALAPATPAETDVRVVKRNPKP